MLIEPMIELLERWNSLEATAAADEILPCNGSHAWSAQLAVERPFADADALLAASDRIWCALSLQEWNQAFATHPRIGERDASAAAARALAWSGKEQAAAEIGSQDEAQRLADLNRRYEARFGRVFLICASGRSRPEILAELKRRLHRTDAEELAEAVEQQRQITRLRLLRWLEGA